jgi:hypothetical protein
MLTQLITLPFRSVRGAIGLAKAGLDEATSLVADRLGHGTPPTSRVWAPPQNGGVSRVETPPVATPQPSQAFERVPSASDQPRDDHAPAHVDDSRPVVAESADPGAADGAGAAVTFMEPWPGYDECRAQDIVDRLSAASPEELAVTELYEATKKRRKTVLAALRERLEDADSNSG